MTTFLDVVELLLTDGDAKANYSADPGGFLNEHGLGGLDSADVADAMLYASDSLPLPVATQLDPEAGLDSAAALDLEAGGLSLEREAYDAAAEQDAVDEDALGDDVDFDAPAEAAGGIDQTDLDAVDMLDAPDGGGSEGDSAAGAVDSNPTIDTVAAAPSEVLADAPAEVDVQPDSDDDLDDLTDFVPTEEVVIETPDERLDNDLDDLDVEALLDVDPDDLDFLD